MYNVHVRNAKSSNNRKEKYQIVRNQPQSANHNPRENLKHANIVHQHIIHHVDIMVEERQ